MAQRRILYVLGMHRSGTSALCAALESCGVSFGENLLDSMPGVNERGFWEDASVVALNERLLERLGSSWFEPPQSLERLASDEFEDLRGAAREFLSAFPEETLIHGIKDPRLCITLPLWLDAAEDTGVPVSVVVINRAPLEVASSLEKRDGFPLGYGLRLFAQYWRLMQPNLPADTAYLTYDALLADAAHSMQVLAQTIPLEAPPADIETTVQPALRHFKPDAEESPLRVPHPGQPEVSALEAQIESAFPMAETLRELASMIVQRGEKLTALGEEHATALETLKNRDADVQHLSQLHTDALAIVAERDAQIAELDERLAQTGEHLSQALATLNERDAQLQDKVKEIEAWEQNLQRVLETPIVNRLFYRMWYREER